MTRLHLPTRHRVLNRFAGATWWRQAVAPSGVRCTTAEDAVTLSWDGERPLAPGVDTVLVLTEPITDLARTPDEVEAWADAVVDVAAAAGHDPVVVAVKPEPPTGIEELLAAAARRRWPLLDPGAEVSMPALPNEPGLRRFAELVVAELEEQADSMSPPSAITRALGLTDAITALRYATTPVTDPVADPASMCRATDTAAGRLADAGVTFCGPVEALHWPRAQTDGRLDTESAARVAVAVLRGAAERTDPLSAGLDTRMAEIDALEDRVRAAEQAGGQP